MRRTLFVGILVAATVHAICYGDETLVELKQGQHRKLDADTTIRFVAVTSDSRCPEGVNCIQAGEATVDLALTAGGAESTLTVGTAPANQTASAGGYTVQLRRLLPDPPPEGGVEKKYELSVAVTKATTGVR